MTDYVDDKCLVLVNHQSHNDPFILANMFTSRPRASQRLMWVIAKKALLTPLGLLAMVRKDVFISKYSKVK